MPIIKIEILITSNIGKNKWNKVKKKLTTNKPSKTNSPKEIKLIIKKILLNWYPMPTNEMKKIIKKDIKVNIYVSK